ncbi:hypothetical protein Psch_03544 [Pelotomaculum schinkii]|uniref:Uncharacterized protein n=1 Tax=Pelotomaculum schinkii TaxID=78350 RepID=A0A4Y7R7P3_9FIRM|nr:hypothetical protein [Pelotomaculum schinkii]TEB04782.1 hypothetical protein Psch_03544 [Pelotomaculum schinkii]
MTNEEFQALVLRQLQSLNEGQVKLTEGQAKLTEEQVRLSEGQVKLTEEQVKLAEGQARLTEGQKEIRKDLTKLETRMENEVFNKIGALFDARSMQNDKNDQIIEKLSEMDDKLDFALLKITQHEVKLMTQKKLSSR